MTLFAQRKSLYEIWCNVGKLWKNWLSIWKTVKTKNLIIIPFNSIALWRHHLYHRYNRSMISWRIRFNFFFIVRHSIRHLYIIALEWNVGIGWIHIYYMSRKFQIDNVTVQKKTAFIVLTKTQWFVTQLSFVFCCCD